ncbi:hypothetical protein HYV49_06310 [Candidatus Pacearchaeota archaeon]|nr:hypothetical protein [Candidatus Pacearchaeota archaeon]
MKRSFFVYSDNRADSKEFLRGLKNWLPMEIDIIEAKIKNKYLLTLDEKLIDYAPLILRSIERPFYITDKAYNVILNAEKYFKGSEAKRVASIFSELRAAQEVVNGRNNLRSFIDRLRKY